MVTSLSANAATIAGSSLKRSRDSPSVSQSPSWRLEISRPRVDRLSSSEAFASISERATLSKIGLAEFHPMSVLLAGLSWYMRPALAPGRDTERAEDHRVRCRDQARCGIPA